MDAVPLALQRIALMNFPVEKIRGDFPILKRKIGNHALIYLDSAASSQKPLAVIRAMNDFMQMSYANIHRGVYTIAEEATELYETARVKVAKFIGAASPQEIIFTRSTTESINLVRYAFARKFLRAGDAVLLTEMEHHSNLVPWQLVTQETNATLKYLPFDSQGRLELDRLDGLLDQNVKLAALNMVSNTLGTVNPVKIIIEKAHAREIPVLLDAAQAVPHLSINVANLDCDFLAFSGHKMVGPTGIGVLYAKKSILEKMDPFLGGGEMIKEVYWDRATWNDLPWKFEAGTQSITEAVGLSAAVDYLSALGMEPVHNHEKALVHYCMEKLAELKEVRVYGPPAGERCGLVAFNVDGIHAHDVAAVLDRNGIAIRAGHHCTQPLHRKLGVEATCRASFYIYNTREEIDLFTQSLQEARRIFKI